MYICAKQLNVFSMSAELVTASEALRILNVTPARFIKLQELGCFRPVVSGNRWVLYQRESLLKELGRGQAKNFPSDKYATVSRALEILDVSRRTFYIQVAKGAIKLHKQGRRSFVKLTDLYTTDELF